MPKLSTAQIAALKLLSDRKARDIGILRGKEIPMVTATKLLGFGYITTYKNKCHHTFARSCDCDKRKYDKCSITAQGLEALQAITKGEK